MAMEIYKQPWKQPWKFIWHTRKGCGKLEHNFFSQMEFDNLRVPQT